MSAPVAPTAASLITEAYRRAGIMRSPTPAEVERGKQELLEEIKDDLSKLGGTFKSLQTEAVMITTVGISSYPMPTNILRHSYAIRLLVGAARGLAQAGTASSITLAADYTDPSGNLTVGKRIAMTSGTAKNKISQCSTWNNSTKVATMSPDFVTTPATNDGYLIVDREELLTPIDESKLDQIPVRSTLGEPERFAIRGNETAGKLELHPVPNAAYPLLQRYNLDLQLLDVDSVRMATLYRTWRNAWINGIIARIAEEQSRRAEAQMEYRQALAMIRSRECEGSEIELLTARVLDYA